MEDALLRVGYDIALVVFTVVLDHLVSRLER